MSLYKKIVFLWVVFVLMPLSASAFTDGVLKVVVDAYNPPNMYLRDGRAAGLYPLLLKTIFERMHEEVEIDAVPWKRAMHMGAQGRVGVGGIYKTNERLMLYDFSDPVYNELLLVFARKGASFAFNGVDDLRGKKVGIILGWSYGAEFDNAKADGLFEVEPVNRDYLNFKKLSEGRLDCVVASRESGLFEIASNQYLNIVVLENSLLINPTYVAFAKHMNKKPLLLRFNEALKKMREEGEYRKLVGDFVTHIAREGVADTQ